MKPISIFCAAACVLLCAVSLPAFPAPKLWDKPNLVCKINAAGLSDVNMLHLSVQVDNIGNTAATDSSLLTVLKQSNGRQLFALMAPPMGPGESRTFELTGYMPAAYLLPGLFVINAYADYSNRVDEENEYDNSAELSFEVPAGLPLPELAIALRTAPQLSGDTLRIGFNLKNTGGGVVPADVALCAVHLDSSLNWYTGMPLGAVSFSDLPAGQEIGLDAVITLPVSMRSGRYFMEISVSNDLNSTNNSLLVPFVVPLPYKNPPSLILLGAGTAMALRQQQDQTYQVLIKTPDDKARVAQVTAQGMIQPGGLLGLWGQQTKFAGREAFVSLRRSSAAFELVKMTVDGAIVWMHNFNTEAGIQVSGVSPLPDGGFVVCGNLTIPNPTGPSSQRPFLLRTDSLGTELWRRTDGPLAANLTDIVGLPNGDYAAISATRGYLEQKFGYEIFQISRDGSRFTLIDAALTGYDGWNSAWGKSLHAGPDSTVYYAADVINNGKWTTYYEAFYGKSGAWEVQQSACGGVCVDGNGSASALALIPLRDGGGLTLGILKTNFSEYYVTRLNAQGRVLWRKPLPQRPADGLQNATGQLVLCGNAGAQAYLCILGDDGNPRPDDQACASDQMAPVIDGCPDTIVTKTPDPEVWVSWTSPTAADNCGVASLSTNRSPGYFPAGDHLVQYTATDLSGNKSTCKFVVSVIQMPCMAVSNYSYCNDNLTPDNSADDSLHLLIRVNSATPGQWRGTFIDAPGFSAFTGDFSKESHFVFSLADISPYLLDGHLMVLIAGINGHPCEETVSFSFNPSDFCSRILALMDFSPENLQIVQPGPQAAGQPCAIQFALLNKGNIAGQGLLHVSAQLSRDTIADPNDPLQVLEIPADILPGGVRTVNMAFMIPANTSPGDYYALLAVDEGNRFVEFNENNNRTLVSLTVGPNVSATEALTRPYRLSPNPFEGIFYVQCPSEVVGQALYIRLYDTEGRCLWHDTIVAETTVSINPGPLPVGVYTATILNARPGIQRLKLVKAP